jgi:glycosyltransferase involved in cell wall biosynthesis
VRGFCAGLRILLVTQMWPTEAEPDLGAFLLPLVRELREAGHVVDVCALSQRGGSATKYARLCGAAVRAARRFRPDVVFAHFLFPAGFAGLLAARASRAPLVVMAHGQDVANLDRVALRAATAPVVRGSAAVIANSSWLAGRLRAHFPRVEPVVIDLGVDLSQFAPGAAAPAPWPGAHPRFLCVGSLIDRKNVLPLATAFEHLGRGSLVFVGDGPLRAQLESRASVTVVGRIPHTEVPSWIAAADVLCQPSLLEPFGLATLEAMALERTVIATAIGGPPEFVTPAAGILVDPHDPAALATALRDATTYPTPNPAAREAAAAHDATTQAARMAEVLQQAITSRR